MRLDLSGVSSQITGFVTNVVGTNIFALRLIAELNGFARPAVAITYNGGGGLSLSFFGIPGDQFVVQRSSDLATWEDIYTNAVAADASFLFTNTITPSDTPDD
jgi:hypothetical protein